MIVNKQKITIEHKKKKLMLNGKLKILRKFFCLLSSFGKFGQLSKKKQKVYYVLDYTTWRQFRRSFALIITKPPKSMLMCLF